LLLAKILASSLASLWAKKAFVLNQDQLYTLMTRLATDTPDSTMIFGEEISYEKNAPVYSLWGFLQYLSYSWFSYNLISLLLSITFIVLVLNFIKQIIGLNVFGIYYPVLFAVILAAVWFPSIIFIFFWLLSILSVNIFSRKVHLLLHAKRSLLISIYILFFLIFLGLDNFFELHIINYSLFENPLIIFPIFISIILADKIFQDDIDFGAKSWIIDFTQYVIISGIIYFMLQYKPLQYFLISYPDIIILVVVLNVLIWRYMWLQLIEYFRFSPLLRKLNEEEE
jgi:hypothetical protein